MRNEKIIFNRMRGLSLVELMVAITIGVILLGGAVTLFVNNRDTYKTTNELSRLQETARYALDMMVKDIRMAGYFGCADRLDTVSTNVPVATDGELWDFNLDPAATIVPPIEGMDEAFTGDGFQPSGFGVVIGNDADNGEILAGTDAITLRYVAGSMVNVTAPATTLDFQVTADAIAGANSTLTTERTTGFAENQVASISDCGGSDIFRINAPTTATTIRAESLSRAYNAVSSPLIAPYVAVRYYIGDNGRGPGGAVYPSLYRAVISWDAGAGALVEDYQELFEGVEQMQILYGVDNDGDGIPDVYARASGDDPLRPGDPDTNWANIVSVRLAIVVRTVDEHGRADELNIDDNVYTVNDHDIPAGLRPPFDPPDDRRRRRVFTTTAAVRNLS